MTSAQVTERRHRFVTGSPPSPLNRADVPSRVPAPPPQDYGQSLMWEAHLRRRGMRS